VSETVKKSKASYVVLAWHPGKHRGRTHPSPSTESNAKEQPLLKVELGKQGEGVGQRRHGRFEGGDARGQVLARTHVHLGIVILVAA